MQCAVSRRKLTFVNIDIQRSEAIKADVVRFPFGKGTFILRILSTPVLYFLWQCTRCKIVLEQVKPPCVAYRPPMLRLMICVEISHKDRRSIRRNHFHSDLTQLLHIVFIAGTVGLAILSLLRYKEMDAQKIKVLARILMFEVRPYARPLGTLWRFRGQNCRIPDTTHIEYTTFQKIELGLLIRQGHIILDLS